MSRLPGRGDPGSAGAPAADLLALTQWLSPAFPLGGFAYSHGLEAAIADGDVASAETLYAWLHHLMWQGTGWADAVLLHATLRGEPAEALAALARALAASAERDEEAMAQGAALARTVNALTGQAEPARPLVIALGVAARGLDLPAPVVVALYLQAFASNLTSCATRFVPLGQTEAQGALARLAPDLERIAAETEGVPVAEIGSAAFGADLAAMRHETMTVRIFKT